MQKRHTMLAWALGAGLTLLLFAALFAVSNFRYENSDDALILKSLMGFEGGVPSDFSLYVHTLLMGALAALSRALPGKPWFSLLQLGLLGFSCTVLAKSLLQLSWKHRKFLAGPLVAALYLALFAAFACCRVNYTTTAALAGAASLLQCMAAGLWEGRRAKTLRAMALAFVLLAAAWCLRAQSAWPTVAYWLLWLVWRLWVRARGRQTLRPVLLTLLALAVLAGGLTAIRQVEIASRGLQLDMNWQQARTSLLDYTAFDSDPAPALAADSGLTAAEVSLARQWYFLDANMTTQALQTMAAAYPAPSLSLAATRLAGFAAATPAMLAVWGIFGLLCLLCWLNGRHAEPGLAAAATLALAGAMLMVGYLGYQGRLLARAVDTALYPCGALLFGLALRLPPMEKPTVAHRAAFAVCLCGLLFFSGYRAADTLHTITRKPDAVSPQREQDLEAYALAHPETLVVRSPMLLRDTRLFPTVANGVPGNILLWGDWNCRTPGWYAQVAQYGLDGHTFAAADWLNESLVLAGVDDREAQTLARWITEATGTTVSPSLAGAQGTLYLYRFQKGSV